MDSFLSWKKQEDKESCKSAYVFCIDKPPFALKLKERNIDGINVFGNEIFRLKTIKVDVTNYDVIVTYLETMLRKKFNPIVGKQ